MKHDLLAHGSDDVDQLPVQGPELPPGMDDKGDGLGELHWLAQQVTEKRATEMVEMDKTGGMGHGHHHHHHHPPPATPLHSGALHQHLQMQHMPHMQPLPHPSHSLSAGQHGSQHPMSHTGHGLPSSHALPPASHSLPSSHPLPGPHNLPGPHPLPPASHALPTSHMPAPPHPALPPAVDMHLPLDSVSASSLEEKRKLLDMPESGMSKRARGDD